jgi:hypothetical protein
MIEYLIFSQADAASCVANIYKASYREGFSFGKLQENFKIICRYE